MSNQVDQIEIFDGNNKRSPSNENSSGANDPSQKSDEKKEVDPRNKLNDLTGKEWLPATKSFFFQKGLGAKHPHAQIEKEHPAPFSFQDIERLIRFFTKEDQIVLDPFSGVGSTVKACAVSNRKGVGVELSERWHNLAIKRINKEVQSGESENHNFILGDCRKVLHDFPKRHFDFIVTSPPYWSILNKKADHKAIERVKAGLATSYSESEKDLGNIEKYEDFLSELVNIFEECGRVLKRKKYMALVVSDFRNKSRFYSFHSDLIQRLDQRSLGPNHKLSIQGVKVLIQNHKSLKPYGYPFAYVENIHHQYILIFRKVKSN